MKAKRQTKATSNPKRRGGITKNKLRKGWEALTPTGKVAATAAGVAVGAGLIAGGNAIATKRFAPRNVARRAEAPAMVKVAQAKDFHQYDRMALEKKLKGRTRETVLKHWDKITEIAGTNYNTLAVLDTLSRAPGSLDRMEVEKWEQRASGMPRARRKLTIFRNVENLAKKDKKGTEAMLQDLFKLPSYQLEGVRHTYYGDRKGNWQYGNLISGSHTNPSSKAKQFKRLDKKSEKMKAKARN